MLCDAQYINKIYIYEYVSYRRARVYVYVRVNCIHMWTVDSIVVKYIVHASIHTYMHIKVTYINNNNMHTHTHTHSDVY